MTDKIKSKDEIYQDQTRKHLGNNPNGTRMEIIEDSMGEFADQEAVRFAQWICKHGYDSKQIAVNPVWSKGHFKGEFTSAELYEMFKIEPQL